eukprot:CAMPEP_0176450216 /NCGR_PEP_ID=MMETSP0127-20121128/27005_1 /TAXON_ID=938130 /ORGANISM="Platyophrya macrostoma, Strain WH" /LENGTH=360 /DNA_ID=CAMNT_0017837831 /DNA_START=102 /DNA_END=1184 /DNA_ORIENTATION=+
MSSISNSHNDNCAFSQTSSSDKFSVKTETEVVSQPESNKLDVISKLTRKQTIRKFFKAETGKKVYICFLDSCSRQFNHLSSLIKHERIHRNERPYVCRTCGLSFIQSSNLKRHEKSHMGEKPYKCELCPKQFSTACNLRQHAQIHESCSGELKYACTKCGKSYIYTSSLIKHQKKCTQMLSEDPKDTESEIKEDNIRKIVKTEEVAHSFEKPANLNTSEVCKTYLSTETLEVAQTPKDKIISDLSASVRNKQYPMQDQSFSAGCLSQFSTPRFSYPSYSSSISLYSQNLQNAGTAASRLGFGFNDPTPMYQMQNRHPISLFNVEPTSDPLVQAAIERSLLQRNMELRQSIRSSLFRYDQF